MYMFVKVLSWQNAAENVSTHWGRETHICVRKPGRHWFRYWFAAWPALSHYLNQCWDIVNWTLRNKLRWNLHRNSCTFIEEYAFENFIWEMAAILPRPQCVYKGIHVTPALAKSPRDEYDTARIITASMFLDFGFFMPVQGATLILFSPSGLFKRVCMCIHVYIHTRQYRKWRAIASWQWWY